MGYAIAAVLVASHGAAFLAGRKHGQQVVLKALEAYHLALSAESSVKQAFVNFIAEIKAKF